MGGRTVLAVVLLVVISSFAVTEAQRLGVEKRKMSGTIMSGGTARIRITAYTFYNRYNVGFETEFRTTNAALTPPFVHAIHNASDDTPLLVFPTGSWTPNHDDDDGVVTAYTYKGVGALMNSNKYTGTTAAAAAPLAATRIISLMVRRPYRFRVKLLDSGSNLIGQTNLRMGD